MDNPLGWVLEKPLDKSAAIGLGPGVGFHRAATTAPKLDNVNNAYARLHLELLLQLTTPLLQHGK